jgi:surface antigen
MKTLRALPSIDRLLSTPEAAALLARFPRPLVTEALRSVVAAERRAVATIVGVIAGAVIGNRIGRELDEADRGCFGHALEIAQPGQRITWTNESAGVRYEMSPGNASPRHGASCRTYTLVTVQGRERSSQAGVACQSQPGVWQAAR